MIRVRLRVTAFIALVLVFGILFPAGALASTPPPAAQVIGALDPFARDHVPGSLLVALTDTTAPTVHLDAMDTLVHLQVASSYEERTSPTEERETYARLLADPRVASVEP
ncbi:MAG: hypothetical protein LC748_16455, partial [Thermomicrobia bacterium]|nr:hypothetical protein [Thermomicrobia bacterium]